MEINNKIAFVGKMHSGKTTALESIARIIRDNTKIDVLLKLAHPLYESQKHFRPGKNRIFLQKLSDLAKECFGENILSELFEKQLEYYEEQNVKNYFVYLCDDVRVLSDFETVKKLGFYTIGIESNDKTRKERNPELFVGTKHKTEYQIDELMHKTDQIIYNESTLENFENQIKNICKIHFDNFKWSIKDD